MNWRKIREWDSKGFLIDRLEGDLGYTRGGYVFDRRVFRVFLIGLFGLIAWFMFSSNVGFHEFYLVCPGPTPCDNQFYHACDRVECRDIENMEVLPAGFAIGTPPDPVFERDLRLLFYFIVGGLVVSFVANHWIHNKGRSLETIIQMDGEK